MLLVEWDFSYSCAAADKISTDLRRRSRGPSAIAELLVLLGNEHEQCIQNQTVITCWGPRKPLTEMELNR